MFSYADNVIGFRLLVTEKSTGRRAPHGDVCETQGDFAKGFVFASPPLAVGDSNVVTIVIPNWASGEVLRLRHRICKEGLDRAFLVLVHLPHVPKCTLPIWRIGWILSL